MINTELHQHTAPWRPAGLGEVKFHGSCDSCLGKRLAVKLIGSSGVGEWKGVGSISYFLKALKQGMLCTYYELDSWEEMSNMQWPV